ncbi:MAG: MOSC domain-containing protein [Candidatus Hodarchaeales archaeon]|jgi:MOSC domain-containing protein YiiM
MKGTIIQVNTKSKRNNEVGLPKLSVIKAFISKMNVGDDYNSYRMTQSSETINNRAVLLYPIELIEKLNFEGWPIKPGDLGENFTTRGIDYKDFQLGKQFMLGDSVIIEITQECTPCSNLSVLPFVGKEKINDFIKTIMDRRGMYAKVLQEGEVTVNDKIILI